MIQLKTDQVYIFESALFRTTSTIVQTEDLILLVDPTWLPQEIEAIRIQLDAMKADRPVYLLFTHSDYDHIIAWRAFPEAQTIASKAFTQNPEAQVQLDTIRKFDDENYILRDYPVEYPRIDHIIEGDQQTLEIGQTRLVFYQSPGHNPDGLFCIVEPIGLWITGDYLSNIEFPYIYHSSTEYERSLSKVEDILTRHDIQILIPGHGDHTKSIKEIRRRASVDLNYIKGLRESLLAGLQPSPEELYQPILFPIIMGEFHRKNIQLMKKELNL